MNNSNQRPDLQLEMALFTGGIRHIAGIDEAGRGALAGPVVAAAVILPLELPDLANTLHEVHDSKQLSPKVRQRAYDSIHRTARAISVGSATSNEVDELGLLPATRLAMSRAVAILQPQPQHLLLDYMLLPEQETTQTSQAKADSKSLSVAAASVIAKVTRDRWMVECDKKYPGYDFSQHKGYGTVHHRQVLSQLGPSPVHRLSYAPVAASVAEQPPG